jgi:glycosyltransferase involved in cell wall biosynthesis
MSPAESDFSLLIIVPTLNSWQFLPVLVDSLVNQSFKSWRLLFVDGASCIQHRNWLQECCQNEPRCSWIEQNPSQPGIFGAMNSGLDASAKFRTSSTWILFWGSDDWAASCKVLSDLEHAFLRLDSGLNEVRSVQPDLIVCSGRYADGAQRLHRKSSFFRPVFRSEPRNFLFSSSVMDSREFASSLFWGSTPPHQATLFSARIFSRPQSFNTNFFLSADLDFFLRLSSCSDLLVYCIDIELVHMSSDGVSSKRTWLRLLEVFCCYISAFGMLGILSLFARYARRFLSVISWSRKSSRY